MKILVTGGCGFIGSNFLNLFVPLHPEHEFLNVDVLTYAANPLNLSSLSDSENYSFQQIDLADEIAVEKVFTDFEPDWIVHFAAETHVDRSIKYPREFLKSNIIGTFNLLESARNLWGDHLEGKLFHHVSTDEVYGELGEDGLFREDTAYAPSSPYSASKASSDHLVRAWFKTYGLPVTISNCSNNYGPYQFPEKLIPVMVEKAKFGEPLPVYGDGKNVRDWLHVEDHARAIWKIMQEGVRGETYNIGGKSERENIEVVKQICRSVANWLDKPVTDVENLITFVKDRPGHDFRYAIDTTKIETELGWTPKMSFEEGLDQTVKWYLENQEWIESVKSGEYLNWMKTHYGESHG